MSDRDVMILLGELLRKALDRGLIEARPRMTKLGRRVAIKLVEDYDKEVEKND